MQWLLLVIIAPYLYHILRISQYLARIKPFKPSGSIELPFISVIVACRNEEKNLPQLLESLSLQDYPADDFEVIIIDDNSTDGTYSFASSIKKIKNLRILRSDGKGKKAALRLGVVSASAGIIVTTDADCKMTSGWLGCIAVFFAEKNPGMILCPVAIEGGKGFFRRFQELEFLSLQGITAGTAACGDPVMCNGANLTFLKKTYLDNQGSIHEEIPGGDDVFLLHAAKSNNDAKIMWLESPDAMVTTASSPDFTSFIRQRTRWLSKAGAYKDRFTRVLGIVTFVTILLQVSLLAAGFFNHIFMFIFLAVFLLKSIPDFLILINTTGRYNKRALMKWFLPSQLIYPFYILIIVVIQASRALFARSA